MPESIGDLIQLRKLLLSHNNFNSLPNSLNNLVDLDLLELSNNQFASIPDSVCYMNIDFLYGITVDRRNQAFQTTSGYKAKFVQSLPLIMDSSSLQMKY